AASPTCPLPDPLPISPGERAPRTYLFSGHATRSLFDVRFERGDLLVFGRESVGLPEELLEERADDVVGIPMPGPVRSLNLANAVDRKSTRLNSSHVKI